MTEYFKTPAKPAWTPTWGEPSASSRLPLPASPQNNHNYLFDVSQLSHANSLRTHRKRPLLMGSVVVGSSKCESRLLVAEDAKNMIVGGCTAWLAGAATELIDLLLCLAVCCFQGFWALLGLFLFVGTGFALPGLLSSSFLLSGNLFLLGAAEC